MKILLINHAKQRIEEREITFQQIKETINFSRLYYF